jgi:hypothetical protein
MPRGGGARDPDRHIGAEQARLAEDGAVSCDLLNEVSARYQKVASAVQSLERAAAREDQSAHDAELVAETAKHAVAPRATSPQKDADGGGNHLRQRNPASAASARAELLGESSTAEGDVEPADHARTQESLAADMLDMTKMLKHILKETGSTLEVDEDVVASATAGADRSITKQGKANDLLAEQIKRSGGCWMWILLLTVAISFLAMIVFMRIF